MDPIIRRAASQKIEMGRSNQITGFVNQLVELKTRASFVENLLELNHHEKKLW